MEKRTSTVRSTVVPGTNGADFGAMVDGTAKAIPNPNMSSGPTAAPAGMKSPDDNDTSLTPATIAPPLPEADHPGAGWPEAKK